MNICQECGTNLKIMTVHLPGCSQGNAEETEVVFEALRRSPQAKGAAILGEMITERAILIYRKQLNDFIDAQPNGVMLRLLAKKELEKIEENSKPLMAMTIVAMQLMLTEHDVLDQEKYNDFLILLGTEFDGFPE